MPKLETILRLHPLRSTSKRSSRRFSREGKGTANAVPFHLMQMNLEDVVTEIANAVMQVDTSRVAFRAFQPGAGPYGEPQLVKNIAAYFNALPGLTQKVLTKRTPDMLIKDNWAIEFKIVRPYGDNGLEAENWSVNLLHPYKGNVSTLGDCWKLNSLGCQERKAVVVIGYEHLPSRIDLSPLIDSFEVIAKHVAHLKLSGRIETRREGLVHPVHQVLRIFAWEVLGTDTA